MVHYINSLLPDEIIIVELMFNVLTLAIHMEFKMLQVNASDIEICKDEHIIQKRSLKSERKKKLESEIEAAGNDMVKKTKIETRRSSCDNCGRSLACRSSLSRHKRKCKSDFTLMWNGKSWETRSSDVHYKLNLGRDLSNLLERGAIKDDALNSCQIECIQMYKALFVNVES